MNITFKEPKPLTITTMLLSSLKDGNLRNYILNLSDFDMEYKEDKVIVTIYHDPSQIEIELDSLVILCISDDPYMTWAGDWSHLGCARLKIKMDKLKEIARGDRLHLVCDKKDFEREFIIADRCMKDEDKLPLW